LRETLDRCLGIVELLALDDLSHHRRRCLADRAAAPGEGDFADDLPLFVDADRNLDFVAAQRIVAPVGQCRMFESTVVTRILIVVEDDFARQVFSSHVHRCSSPTWTVSPSRRTSWTSTGSKAGSWTAAPVRTSKRAPWRGHSISASSSSPWPCDSPSCVHRSSIA